MRRGLFPSGQVVRPILLAGILFAAALAAGLLFSAAFPLPAVQSDAAGYLVLAQNVAEGRGFTQDGILPALYRPPLFSTLLGGWFFLTGTASAESAACFQSLLHAGGVAVAFFLFLELVPAGLAFGGALFLALQPVLFTRVVFVLQEPTLLLSTTLAVLASLRLIRASTVPKAFAAGVAWGVCILGKTVAFFAPPLIFALRWLPVSCRPSIPRRHAFLLLLATALAVAPWTIRNAARFGRFIPVNGQGGGMILWNILHTEVTGDPEREPLIAALRQDGGQKAETRERTWRFIRRHPREFLLERTLRNAVTFAAPPRDWWISRGMVRPNEHRPIFWTLSLLFWIPPYAGLVAATLSAVRKRAAAPGLCFLILFYWGYWAEHALVWGDPRFGLAVYPVLIAIALSQIEAVCRAGRIPGPATGRPAPGTAVSPAG